MYNKITYVFEKKIHGLFLFRLVIPAHIGLIYTLFLLYKILLFTVDNTMINKINQSFTNYRPIIVSMSYFIIQYVSHFPRVSMPTSPTINSVGQI
jgi:hypothetical protein